MYDYGHFCLLILAQDKWKAHFKEQLKDDVSAEFLSLLEPRSQQEAIKIGWNETPKESLFDPKDQTKCQSCSALYPLFVNKKGVNEGLILYSHSLPDKIGVKSFLNHLLDERRIKKVYYLELGFGEELKPDEVSGIDHKQISITEFINSIDKGQFETRVLYDILKQKYTQ